MLLFLFVSEYFSPVIWRIPKNYKCFLKILGKQSTENDSLSCWSLSSWSQSYLHHIIIFRLITCHNKIKLAFFYGNDVPDVLVLIVRNLFIVCIVLPCGGRDAYTSSLYSMKCVGGDTLVLVWICASFGCRCVSLSSPTWQWRRQDRNVPRTLGGAESSF